VFTTDLGPISSFAFCHFVVMANPVCALVAE